MSYMRFMIDGAIPLDVYNTIPQAKKNTFKNAVLALKAYCQKITEQEDTVRFKWHTCRHDEGGSCDPEQDI